MKCEIIQDLLSSYIDKTCSEETRKMVEEHLMSCEECKQLHEELLNETHEVQTIQEGNVFKKVRKGFYKKLFLGIIFVLILVFGFGTELNCFIVKARMNLHVAMNPKMSEYGFKMTSFEYHDYGIRGFGKGGSYVASFNGGNYDEIIVVSTDGFWLSIDDSFEHHILKKHRTAERLASSYERELLVTLSSKLPEMSNVFGDGNIYYTTHVDLEPVNIKDKDGLNDYHYAYLTLNMTYKRSLDQKYPFRVNLYLNVNQEQFESKEIIGRIVNVLKEENFNPSLLTIKLNYNGQESETEIINLNY